jgi:glyoxylase I family protein
MRNSGRQGRLKEGIQMVTKIDHIELVVHRFDEYIALFRALGFRELTRTKHHGDSVELQLPGENQPIFEIHRVSGEENIGVNHIAFQVPDVQAAQRELAARGIATGLVPAFVPSTGRTNLNFRDPDGWRLQLVDATRATPDLQARH